MPTGLLKLEVVSSTGDRNVSIIELIRRGNGAKAVIDRTAVPFDEAAYARQMTQAWTARAARR
jgi:hypothetical protein